MYRNLLNFRVKNSIVINNCDMSHSVGKEEAISPIPSRVQTQVNFKEFKRIFPNVIINDFKH